MLSTTLIFAPGASVCDISRTDSTHVDTPDFFGLCELRHAPDCRGGSVWVGSALKKYRILEIYVFAATLETRP